MDYNLMDGLSRMLQSVGQHPYPLLLVSGSEWTYPPQSPVQPTVWYMESHENYELAYVDAGPCVITIENKAYTLSTGDLCILCPGEEHYESPVHPGNYYRIYWLYRKHGKYAFHITEYAGNTRNLKYVIPPTTVAKSTGIDAILDHVVYEARTGNIFVDWIMRGHLLSVLGLIGRQLQDIFENMEAEPAVARNQNKNIGKAISFIEANYADPGIGVPDIARHIGLCPNYFSVYFKKHIGQSPYNYLLRTRIKSAGQLLCESDLSVSEIAYKVGFTDPRHFSTMFKRMCGVSPSVYRNSTRSLDLITKCLP